MDETNRYNRSNSNWLNIDRDELLKFLGLLIMMGIKKLPRIENYWSASLNFCWFQSVGAAVLAVAISLLFKCMTENLFLLVENPYLRREWSKGLGGLIFKFYHVVDMDKIFYQWPPC